MSTKSGMTRTLARLLGASLWLAPVWAAALGVGQIKVYSALNEPLDAEVELLSATPEELATLSADLASPQVFAQAGVDRLALLSGLQFAVQSDARGRDVIQVRSRQPIREPLLNFLVELDWSGGRIVKEFVMLLEPPATTVRRPAPARPAPARPATGGAPVRGAPPSAALPAADDFSGEYTVARGDTLWSIASRLRPDPSISVQQMMQALYRANPNAFVNGDINRLLAGDTLRVPDVGARARPAQAVREAVPRAQPPAADEPAQGPSVRLVSPTPDEEGGQIASATQPGEAAPAQTVAAPSFPQRHLIELNGGRPRLQLAGLDDLRDRIDTLVGVDDAALTAVQERESPAAPEPAAPEASGPEPIVSEPDASQPVAEEPEPVPEAEAPGWMAFLPAIAIVPLLAALLALLARRRRARSAAEEKETAEETAQFEPISLEPEPEPAAPVPASATVVELHKKPAVTKPEDLDFGVLPPAEKRVEASDAETSTDEVGSLLEGFDSLDWELPAATPQESAKPPTGRSEGEPAAARASVNEPDADIEGLDFALEPARAEPPAVKAYNLEPELRELEFAFEQVPVQEQVTEEIHLPPAVGLAESEAVADEDYVATKLDLAAAYVDMDDSVGARSLLEEVLQEGDERQKQKAQDLLRKLS